MVAQAGRNQEPSLDVQGKTGIPSPGTKSQSLQARLDRTQSIPDSRAGARGCSTENHIRSYWLPGKRRMSFFISSSNRFLLTSATEA
jgi:hypothetical protein